MKFLTCNIRRGVCDDGINSFEFRKPHLLDKLPQYKACTHTSIKS